MRRIKQYSLQIIALLLVIVLVESAALVGTLSALRERNPDAMEEQSGPMTEDTLPDWLTPQEPQPEEPETYTGLTAAQILSNAQLIAHGMGKIADVTTLNCLESFRLQYEKGVRVFEVDLRMTSDMQVVLRHDWRAGWQNGVSETQIPTLEEFRAKLLLGKYTPMSFRDLLLLMEDYPDVCVITDSKFTDAETVTVQFEAMLRDAAELGLEHAFERIVVQVYNELMFRVVDGIGDFPNYVYTLYNTGFNQTEEAFEEIAAFCSENGIAGVTMWNYWWRENFKPIAEQYGVSVYVHTVNDAQMARELIESGVQAIYTDEIAPGDLEESPEETEETEPTEQTEGEV